MGDIAELKNGYSFKSDTYDPNSDGEYNIITIKNVTGDRFISLDKCNTISELPSNIRPHQKLKDGDILISMTGNVGRVSINKGSNNLLNQRVGLIELNNARIDKGFLYAILSSNDFEQSMISKGHGAAQPNIGKDDIESYEFKYPDLETQKMIAELLSNYDALIENISSRANSQTTNLINQKQAIIDTIFRGV